MKLHEPFVISSRLLPAVRIGDTVLSLEKIVADREMRSAAVFIWDTPDGRSHKDGTMRSPVGGFRGTVEIFSAYISFAYACKTAEPGSENLGLFPSWLMGHVESHELDYLMFALEDDEGNPNEDLIEVEHES